MTIPFACQCGQQLSARDEHAGLQVRCTACGQVQTVPAAGARKPAGGVSGTIQLTCEQCGKTCQAASEHAGKKTKCPSCGAILTITPPMATRLPDSVSHSQPSRPAGPRRDVPWKWVGIGAGVLAVLLVVVWFVFLRKGGGPDGGTSVADFDLVPRNAEGFVSFRVADAMKTGPGKKAWEMISAQAGQQLQELEEEAGLTAHDIDRVMGVSVDAEKQVAWMVVHTSKAYDQGKVLHALDNPAERTHQGRKYHGRRDGLGLLFVNDRQLALGPAKGIQRCLELPKKPASGPLDEAIELALDSKYHLVIGSNVPQDKLKSAIDQYSDFLEQYKVKTVLEAKTVYVTGILNEQLEFEVGLEYGEKTKAMTVQEELNAALGAVRGLVAVVRLNRSFGKGGDQLIALLEKALGQLKPQQDGSKVTLRLKLDSAALLKALDTLLAEGNR